MTSINITLSLDDNVTKALVVRAKGPSSTLHSRSAKIRTKITIIVKRCYNIAKYIYKLTLPLFVGPGVVCSVKATHSPYHNTKVNNVGLIIILKTGGLRT
jgi:hypothetical protein